MYSGINTFFKRADAIPRSGFLGINPISTKQQARHEEKRHILLKRYSYSPINTKQQAHHEELAPFMARFIVFTKYLSGITTQLKHLIECKIKPISIKLHTLFKRLRTTIRTEQRFEPLIAINIFAGKRLAFYCLTMIICLSGVLFTSYSAPIREDIFIAVQTQEPEAVQTGMGGGYLEDSFSVYEAVVPLIEEIPEPERPRLLLYSTYSVQRGDIIGELAASFGLNQDTLISINGIRNARLVQIGQVLRVPNQDGILYTVRQGDTLESIAERHRSDAEAIRYANELFSNSALVGSTLFLPGARLDWMERQEINGDLFIWPTSGTITSSYGWRRNPFSGVRQFHNGLDIGASMGAPVRAAMSGRVSVVGYDDVLGNFVIITHHSGYRTLYAHMSRARTRTGDYVGTGERIGDVGSTGLSTGPHLHFTVFRNGVTVNPRSLMR